jgi:hypothetical protein
MRLVEVRRVVHVLCVRGARRNWNAARASCWILLQARWRLGTSKFSYMGALSGRIVYSLTRIDSVHLEHK